MLFQRIYKYISDLLDVSLTSPSDGQVLSYDADQSKWVNADPTGGAVDSVNGQTGDVTLTASDVGAAPSSHTHTLSQISNLSSLTVTESQVTNLTTDLAGKAASSHTHNASDINAGTLNAARLPTGIDAANIGSGAVSNTEFGYLDGVTSAIQTQFNAKANAAVSIATTSPLTGGGDLSANRTISFGTQSANVILSGPTTGSPAAPTFRTLVSTDIPNLPISKITSLQSDLDAKLYSYDAVNGNLPVSNGSGLSDSGISASNVATVYNTTLHLPTLYFADDDGLIYIDSGGNCSLGGGTFASLNTPDLTAQSISGCNYIDTEQLNVSDFMLLEGGARIELGEDSVFAIYGNGQARLDILQADTQVQFGGTTYFIDSSGTATLSSVTADSYGGGIANLTAITANTVVANVGVQLLPASSTPTNASTSSDANIYVKGHKLIAQYNDAGTVRYKYLDLTGTGTTWTHSTSAP